MRNLNQNETEGAVIRVVDRVAAALVKAENAAIVALFLFVTIVCFYQVLCRYVLRISAPWTEELSRYSMIWLVLIGSGWAIYADNHIKIDAIYSLVKNRRAADLLNLFLSVLVLAFCACFTAAGCSLIPQTRDSNLLSVGLNIPTYVPMLAMPLGGALMTFHSVCITMKRFSAVLRRRGEEE